MLYDFWDAVAPAPFTPCQPIGGRMALESLCSGVEVQSLSTDSQGYIGHVNKRCAFVANFDRRVGSSVAADRLEEIVLVRGIARPAV
jgi:hypothetical protein